MSDFRTKQVTVRGTEYTVREWSSKIRREFVERAKTDDAGSAGALLVARCVTLNGQPAFATEEDADNALADVVDTLAQEVLAISKAE